MIIDLRELQAEQREFINFLEDRPGIINKRNKLGLTTGQVLATISELYEAGNEAKYIYKWWDKSEVNRDKLLEELSDVLSHLLNMSNDLDMELVIDANKTQIEDLERHMLAMTYELIRFTSSTNKVFDKRRLAVLVMPKFLDLVYSLGFSFEELQEAYYTKLDSNYKRFE